MSDLKDRLGVVERVPVPDLWERAAARSEVVRLEGRVPESMPPRRQRLTAALVAAVVAIGGFVFAVQAFGGHDPRPADPSPAPVSHLDGTSWVLMTIDGESVVRGTERSWMTLAFRNGEYTARSGCDHISGSYEIDRGSLRSTNLGESVSCGPGPSTNEDTFFNAVAMRSEATMHGATLMLDVGEHQLSFVQDPCSLLTPDEVSAAVGGAVEASGLVPPNGMKAPSFGPVCSFDVPTTPFTSVGVDIETSTPQRFESDAAADEANFMDVAGIGERAYISAMNAIVIFDDGRTIEIGFQHVAESAVPVLEALGRAALDGVGVDVTLPSFQRFFFRAGGVGGVFEVATRPPGVCYSTQSSPSRPIDVVTISGDVVLTYGSNATAEPFCDRSIDGDLARDLINDASDYRIAWKPDPAGRRQISTLVAQGRVGLGHGDEAEACSPTSLRFGPVEVGEEAIPPRPHGTAVVVHVRSAQRAPCAVRGGLTISILDGEGVEVPLLGDAALELNRRLAEQTGSGPNSLTAVWRIADWCRPLGAGPHRIELRYEGNVVSRTSAPFLDTLCTEQHNFAAPTLPRPPEGRYSPSVAPLP